MTLKEKLEKRGQLITDARKLRQKAQDEKRDLTGEERQQIDKLLDESDAIDVGVNDESRDARLAALEANLDKPRGRRSSPGSLNGEHRSGYAGGTGPTIYRDASTGEEVRAYQHGEQMAGGSKPSAGKAVRGMITGKWEDAEDEYRAMSGTAQ